MATGELHQVVLKTKALIDQGNIVPVLIFDDQTGRVVDIDYRESVEEMTKRTHTEVESDAPRKVGRPKLGVIPREVTLLPRHWDWLNSQPGGASVALRKLVEEARRANAGKDRIREAQEAAYRFLSAMAGNEPGFEEATRALFAGKRDRFEELTEAWPMDVRDHARKLAARSFGDAAPQS